MSTLLDRAVCPHTLRSDMLRFLHCPVTWSRTNVMSKTTLDTLRAELGAAAIKLPDLGNVPEPALKDFLKSLRTAKQQQKKLLEDSADHSLRLVPALLRPIVRKVLFG